MRRLAPSCRFVPARIALLLLLSCAVCAPLLSQTQQPFLFAAEGSNGQITDFAVFVRNDQTGDLSEVPGSPFAGLHSATCSITVIDPQGRFAYGACGLGAAMYSMNGTTGAVAEVSGSPFAGSPDTRSPTVAAEATGQFVYVLKYSLSDPYPTASSVLLDTFQVDPPGQQLVPQFSQSVQLTGSLVAVASSPHGFYLLLNESQSNSPYPLAALYAILFDSTTGQPSVVQLLSQTSLNARSLLMDNMGKNLVVSAGQDSGSIWFFQLSAADGTVSAVNSVPLAAQEFATPVAFDPTSSFFYLRLEGTGAIETGVRIFAVSTQAETVSSPVPMNLESQLGGQADPQGPFSYFPTPPSGGISVFGVDATTGYPVSPSSFTNPLFPGRHLGPGPATIDVNTQPVQAPAVSLNSAALSFGSVNVGQTSATQTVTLTNTGSLVLSLTSILLAGTNAADFTESNTCLSAPQLQPNKSCSIKVSYHPSVTGDEAAAVVITDDASGSPQQIALTGIGSNPPPPPPPAPAVTLNPSPLNFPGTVTEGTLSAPQNVVLTNSGNATLHIQTVTVGGINSGDFTISSDNCVGALAANANCVVSLTFAPLGPGVRNATLVFADDASNSPQSASVFGTGGAAAQISAASGTGSTVVSVSAGQSAQFNLVAIPGAGFSGTLSFSCGGAPLGATCNVPTSVTVTNGAATAFTVTVNTAGSNALLPEIPAVPHSRGSNPAAFLPVFAVLLCALLLSWRSTVPTRLAGCRWSAAAVLILGSLIVFGGCGGGGGNAMPQQAVVVTPSGSYAISVTPTATSSASAKQFQLPAIALTLNVK